MYYEPLTITIEETFVYIIILCVCTHVLCKGLLPNNSGLSTQMWTEQSIEGEFNSLHSVWIIHRMCTQVTYKVYTNN